MSQPQTLTVDQQEILARAKEVEGALAEPPTDVPAAPCGLDPAARAARQLVLSADNMREYITVGYRELQRLAQSMRNAAKAYGDVDEEGAQALDQDGGTVTAETPGGAGANPSAGLTDTQTVGAADSTYMDVKVAAAKLEEPDQAASMARFASAWKNFNVSLQESIKQRFRVFQNWEGEAATAVEQSMDQQKEWWLYVAATALAMGKQADHMVELHNAAYRGHPRLYDVEQLERLYRETTDPNMKNRYLSQYASYQKTSEEVQDEYVRKSELPAVSLKKPPAAVKIDAPPPAEEKGLIPDMFIPGDGSGGSTTPATPMTPMMPGAGGGAPSTDIPDMGTLTGAVSEAAAKLPSDVGMKPMSVGGGGLGGVGAPGSPMGPALDPESMRPAAAGDPAALGRGNAPGGGAMGGGGMGTPMGAQGQGQGGAKSKGSIQDDEALYTEDRAWTEAVIGNRRRQDSKESK